MKVIELLKLSRESLKLMSENGIKLDDFKFLDVYEEFLCMRRNRVKYQVAIKSLAQENKVSERTLGRILKRLSGNIA